MKLGLGTAQFGLDYGVSNSAGTTSADEVARILALAAREGVGVLDTAPAYGEAEAVLGRALPVGDQAFRIVTKTPRLGGADPDVEEAFSRSLGRLKRSMVHGLLVHNADDLLGPGGPALWKSLMRLKESGRVARIGASVYSGGQIERLLGSFKLELVQLPLNVFDQRLIEGGQLKSLKAAGVEIHARSAFLQGLLLMTPEELPTHFEPVREHLRMARALAASAGLSMLEVCLAFLDRCPEIDSVIIGATSARELGEIIAAATKRSSLSAADFARLAIRDEAILDPSRWPAGARKGKSKP